jgi:TonB family protein
MGSLTTEVPGSVAESKSKCNGTDTLEAEAIGLDVSVRIHGSQVAAVVLDTTEHVEPFEEDTSTMIVFPRGAVVKLRARVRTGHAAVLTNLANKQTALCRIVQVNSGGNVAHYVKVEFIQPAPGFWGVHFPSDDKAPVAAHTPQAGLAETIEKATEPKEPLQNTPAASIPPPQPLPSVEVPRPAPKPLASEVANEKPKPTIAKPVSYGISADVARDEVVPLATAPPKRPPVAPKAPVPIAPPTPPAPSAVNTSTAEPPIFDSLSTGEEIFGKEAPATSTEEPSIFQADQRTAQVFMRSLNSSSLLHGGETPKRHTGLKIILSVAAAAIVAAGAVYYVRQYRGSVRQAASAAIPTTVPTLRQATNANTSPNTTLPKTAAQSPSPSDSVAETPSETRPSTKHTPIQEVAESTITVTPLHNKAKNAASENAPTISNGIANIYAGDLSARPEATQRSAVPMNAPAPAINAPNNLAGTASSAGLGSLVSAPSAALPAPPKPEEPKAVVRGGEVLSPRLIHSVQPIYPSLAMTNHVEGDVQIQAVIDQTGKVTSTKVLSGPTLLRGAAMDAVRQWKYSPAALDGKPITMQYKVTVRFRLAQ